MKIAFVTINNGQDIKSWSGTPFYMSRAFANAGIEVEFIGNLKSYSNRRHLIFRWRNFLYNRAFNKKFGHYESFYEPQNLKYLATQVKDRLNKTDIDIIFSPGSLPIAYLDSNKPIVIWTDAVFAAMQNYYPEFTGMNQRTITNCNLYEKNTLKKISLAFFSSAWAAQIAIKSYGAAQDKIRVIPYGANIEGDRTSHDIEEINKIRSKNVCKLLFIGQHWERKGGEKAVRITKELNEMDIKAELAIAGCTPPNSSSLPDFIKVFGFIDKSKIEGKNLINKLYCESHFFVLPTIAECTPIVFSEANSFGLPVLTHDTGGISSIIQNEINGKMFSNNSDPLEWANYIANIFSEIKKYDDFSLSAFNEYLSRLNWDISIKKVIAFIEEMTVVKSN
jgi:glycosyltransferase involved in cell wall biosynthesis